MTQIALPLFPDTPAMRPADPCASPPAGFDAQGFEIGWDFARHRVTPPADHLHGLHPVRQGWEAGRAAFGARTLKPTRHVRRWLQLRLQAWLQGDAFEEIMVTPRYLAQIEPLQCPVTREVLTDGTGAPSDAVVMRLSTQAGYAAGHLAIVSRRVALARGSADAAHVRSMTRKLRVESLDAAGGLELAQWERLATLLSFVTPLAHERIAALPLRVLPPNRVRVLNPIQSLQVLLTQLLLGEAYARRMTALGSLMPDADTRRCFFLLMNAMLARRLAAGWSADRTRVRTTLEDAWAHPVIERRWEQLALRLRRSDCERIVRLAAQRGLAGPGWRWLDDDAATEGWTPRAQLPGSNAAAAPQRSGAARAEDPRRHREAAAAEVVQGVQIGVVVANRPAPAGEDAIVGLR